MKNLLRYLPLVSSEIYLYGQEDKNPDERDGMFKQIAKGSALFVYDIAGLWGYIYLIGLSCNRTN